MKFASPLSRLQGCALPVFRTSTILLGVSVAISVAIDNLLMAVVLLCVMFKWRKIWQLVQQHPVARSAWLLFGVLIAAMLYGETPLREAAGTLSKYVDLAFIPLFMVLLSGETYRHRAQHAFLFVMGVTLLMSWLVGLEILPVQHWMWAEAAADNPAIFRSHITQNNMMAFAVFLALLKFREASSPGIKMAWGTFVLLGATNVLFMVQGRTGYMILLVLSGWFIWTTLARYMRARGNTWGWQQAIVTLLVLVGLAVIAYQTSTRLHDRVSLASSELQSWELNHGKDTSTGQRLDFYYNTFRIVQQHPVFGVGTGGFADAFAKQVQGTEVMQTRNPHNEYLMVSAQTGLIGLVFMLYLFYTQWRCAPLLDRPFTQDAARGLVLAYLVNCSFNSALMDHADGLFFAFMTAALYADLKPAHQGVAKHG